MAAYYAYQEKGQAPSRRMLGLNNVIKNRNISSVEN
jgi:hypothetical protein